MSKLCNDLLLYYDTFCINATVTSFGLCVNAYIGDASKWTAHHTRDISLSADELCEGQAAWIQTGFTGT